MVKIALIIPCENFIENADLIFQQHNQFYKDEEETYTMEQLIVNSSNSGTVKTDADIILTRGLLAEIMSSLPGDIPVVQISVPTADILRTIRKCIRLYGQKKIGIIAAGNMLAGVTGLEDLSDAPINSYLLSPTWNNEALVDQAVSEGCEMILGGLNTCRYAQMIHIPNMVIQTSREAFWDALSTTKHTYAAFRKEQEKALRLHAILDISHDGIIFIDPARRITTMNRKAQSILSVDSSLIGKRIIDFSFPLKFKNLLSDNNEYANELFQIGRTLLSVNKTFVKNQDVISGSIVNIQLVDEIQFLEGSIRSRMHEKGHVARSTFRDIAGSSPVISAAVETARKYGATNSNVLLIGESGTGKELFAQSIHNVSPRRDKPFVAINCAAIPNNLLESQLFGYAPGTFTGAEKSGKAGLVELAHRGTLFLDEVGEIPLELQAKLLRMLQEREIMRVGGDTVIHVDIRIIAATNQKLEQLVQEKKFREDLFYRLDVLRINLPSLNSHREDIPLLVNSYLEENFPQISISQEALERLTAADWPGNVRQLFNICQRMAVLCSDNHIDSLCARQILPGQGESGLPSAEPKGGSKDQREERSRLLHALEACHYNRGQAAELLGVSRSTLWRWMKTEGL